MFLAVVRSKIIVTRLPITALFPALEKRARKYACETEDRTISDESKEAQAVGI